MKHGVDVRRWVDASGDAPQGLTELLRAGRAHAGGAGEVSELAHRLAAVLGPTSGLLADEASTPPRASTNQGSVATGGGQAPTSGAVARAALNGRGVARLASWAIGGVGAGAALWLVVGGLSSAPSASPPSSTDHGAAPADQAAAPAASPAPRSTPEAPALAPVVEAAPAATVAGEHGFPEQQRRAPAPRAGKAPAPNEGALLQMAQAALQQSPARALELTRRHQASFPHGVLSQEREVIAIEALQRLGRHDAAKARAATFKRRYGGSVHQPRLSGGADTSAPAGGALKTPE